MRTLTAPKIEQAALNNALWCDAVCRTHGCPGEFREAAWVNVQPTPRFYPNAVTLGSVALASLHEARVAEMIEAMTAAGMPTGWAIKDSFETLPLHAPDFKVLFKVLFEAQWLYRAATAPAPPPCSLPMQWEIIRTAAALNAWETAWSGESEGVGIFRPALLKNPDVAIIAVHDGDLLVAGAIAHRAAGSVGLSNIFVPGSEAQLAPACRNAAITGALTTFPNLPLVGYESGQALADLQACGFEAIGRLKVWVRDGAAAAV